MYLFISLNWLGTIVPEQIFEAQPWRAWTRWGVVQRTHTEIQKTSHIIVRANKDMAGYPHISSRYKTGTMAKCPHISSRY